MPDEKLELTPEAAEALKNAGIDPNSKDVQKAVEILSKGPLDEKQLEAISGGMGKNGKIALSVLAAVGTAVLIGYNIKNKKPNGSANPAAPNNSSENKSKGTNSISIQGTNPHTPSNQSVYAGQKLMSTEEEEAWNNAYGSNPHVGDFGDFI